MDSPTPIRDGPYLAPNFSEATLSNPSPLSSLAPSPFSSLVSTPVSTLSELPKEVTHDPHYPPVFDKHTLTYPTQPILYLPPLLSSLPHTFPVHNPSVLTGRVPKTTETRLPDIDTVSLSLHKALHNFAPLTENYAATSYADAFNWDELQLPEDDEHDWYCVAFRSIRKQSSESGPLYEADKLAHEEAIRNGGLIMYWYGIPDSETGLNLATCIWQSRAHAAAANSRPHHIRAMRLAASSYDTYELERWTLRKSAGSRHLEVLPYDGGVAGR
ncbi:hypothetical protein B0F90DRAFT_1092047 [Multifurca ochricompacta]|uniref:Uncharacterized protein n=1 Tax=Multifurca ochricompacta TaxID=376703 RepID=A0AAD4M8Y9_9AGAM|nr:hypothetical protein B0F90DRAFT_1092047 [Multifurca ochricompacta]